MEALSLNSNTICKCNIPKGTYDLPLLDLPLPELAPDMHAQLQSSIEQIKGVSVS